MSYSVEKDWTTEAGLRAVVIADRHRCGYVGVPKGSVLFGKGYNDEIDQISQEAADSVTIGDKSPLLIFTATCGTDGDRVRRSLDLLIECHGGLTYAGGNGDYPVTSDLWWFGFDCAHCDDAPLNPSGFELELDGKYLTYGEIRSLDFCEAQCESISRQLVALEKGELV